jgi:hypothetical protein
MTVSRDGGGILLKMCVYDTRRCHCIRRATDHEYVVKNRGRMQRRSNCEHMYCTQSGPRCTNHERAIAQLEEARHVYND